MLTIGGKHLRKRYVRPNNITDIYSGATHIWPYITDTIISEWDIQLSASQTNVSNEGGSITLIHSTSRTITDVWVNYDGNTANCYKTYTTESTTASLSTTLGTINGNILTIPANSEYSDKTITITASYGGVNKSIIITQEANKTPIIVDYDDWTLNIYSHISTISKSGGSANIIVDCCRRVIWSDGSHTWEQYKGDVSLTTDFGTLSDKEVTGDVGNTTLIVEANNTTNSRTITVSGTVNVYGTQLSDTVQFTQEAGDVPTITSYSDWYLSLSAYPSTISNYTSSVLITADCYRYIYWSNGDVTWEESEELVTLSTTIGYLDNTEVSGNYGSTYLTVGANSSTSSRTIIVSGSTTVGGKYLSESVQITQEAGEEVENPTITDYGDWKLDLDTSKDSISSSGGQTTITANCYRSIQWSDGSYTQENYSGNVSLSTNLGTLSSSTVSGNNGTSTLTFSENTSTDSKTALVTGSVIINGATLTSSVTITQEGKQNSTPTITSYGEWSVSVYSSKSSVSSSGGTSTITAICSRAVNWSDGDTTTEYSSNNVTLSVSSGGTLDKTSVSSNFGTTTLTLDSNNTTSSITVTVTATCQSKQDTCSVTINGIQAPVVNSYGEWSLYVSADPTELTSSGGTSTITATCSRDVNWSDGNKTTEYSNTNITLSTDKGQLSSTSVSSNSGTSTLTMSENTSTSSTVTATIIATCQGKSDTCTVTVAKKPAATITSYGSWNLTVSASPTSISSEGGTSTITADCYRDVNWSDGTVTAEYSSNSISLSTNLGTLSNTSVSSNQGVSTLTILANTDTSDKTATITATCQSKSDTCSVVIEGAEPEEPNYSYNADLVINDNQAIGWKIFYNEDSYKEGDIIDWVGAHYGSTTITINTNNLPLQICRINICNDPFPPTDWVYTLTEFNEGDTITVDVS